MKRLSEHIKKRILDPPIYQQFNIPMDFYIQTFSFYLVEMLIYLKPHTLRLTRGA
jgi:hypothetical protein